VFNPARYPAADRVGSTAGRAHQAAYNLENEYVFGLERMLDGLVALIGRSQTEPSHLNIVSRELVARP